jgi:hypothetical protein
VWRLLKAGPFAEPIQTRTGLPRYMRLAFPSLLIVGNVGLEHSNGARDQQCDDTQRNENLHHSE